MHVEGYQTSGTISDTRRNIGHLEENIALERISSTKAIAGTKKGLKHWEKYWACPRSGIWRDRAYLYIGYLASSRILGTRKKV